MKTWEIIEKVALFFAIISAVFVVLSASATIDLIHIASSTAPAEYVATYTLISLLPYLFIMAVSLVITVICRRARKEETKEEAPPQEEPPQTEEKKEEIDF